MSTLTDVVPVKPKPARRPNRKLLRVLSQPLVLEEAGPPAGLLNLLSVCSVFVAAFVVWSTVTPMQETAATSGQINHSSQAHPSGSRRSIAPSK